MSPIAFAILAYAWWGLVPVYWKQIPAFPPEELTLYRILLSSASLLPLAMAPRERRNILGILGSHRSLMGCLTASLLIGFNWYLYIWAVSSGHIVESSLGYFLNPLVNIALGTLLLKERMNRAQRVACLLAACGTLLVAWHKGSVPWIAILLALSFGLYGFARKVLRFPTLAATFSEAVTLSIPALFLLLWMHNKGGLHLSAAPGSQVAWLALSGVVTTIPLLAFAEAAKALPLSLMGFFQFLSPTLQFLLGVFAYHEPFAPASWAAFAVIWAGLGVFLFDLGHRAGFTCPFMPARK